MAHMIMLVVDDPKTRGFLRALLGRYHEFQTHEAGSPRESLEPSVIVLDLDLHDGSGVESITRLRSRYRASILAISAVDEEREKVRALDLGADDYVTKPLAGNELVARLRKLLRRRIEPDPSRVFCSHGVTVDLAARRVSREGRQLHLTPIEYELLTLMIEHAGKVVPHRRLLEAIWGPDHARDTHYLRTYVGQLRRKLESDPSHPRLLATEPGVGYGVGLDSGPPCNLQDH